MLELGKAIVAEIGVDGREGFTAKWMAHYLAERIEAARSNAEAQEECAELILKLWRARQYFPGGEPFAAYKPLLVALRARVLSEPKHMVHVLFDDARRSKKPPETKKLDSWLDVADEIDAASSVLIAEALRRAASEAGLEKDRLLDLAVKVDADTQTELLIDIRRFADESDKIVADKSEDTIGDAVVRLESAITDVRRRSNSNRDQKVARPKRRK